MKSFRSSIIVCRNIGRRYDEGAWDNSVYTHAGMYRSIDEFDLVCVADNNPVCLEEFRRYWSPGRFCSDYKEMLGNENLDIVSIATPDECHISSSEYYRYE